MKTFNMNVTNMPTNTIGFGGENGVTEVVLDFSSWAEEFGQGAISLLVRRAMDADPYPAVLVTDGTTATWTITDVETSYKGHGEAQWIYTVGEQIKKSAVFGFNVDRSLNSPVAETPEAYETWVERMIELGADVEQIAQQVYEATGHYPKIENGYWYVWDVTNEEWVNTGQKAQGEQGEQGDPGVGISSTVLNADYTLTITFTDGSSYTTPPIRGEKGDAGNGISSTVLNPDYTLTITFTDGTSYTTPSIRGGKGDPGMTPDIEVGTVTTLDAGSDATVTITGTDEQPLLNFGIPKGDTGTIDTAIIAEDYDNLTFPVAKGTPCIYNGEYYVAKQDINASEAWTSAHWDQTNVGDDILSVKSDLQAKLDEPSVAGTQGQVLTSDGDGGQTWEDPQGGGGTVDDALSTSSTNPVQNKVITKQLNDVASGKFIVQYGTTANKALNNKGEIIANNNRTLSDFIPVTPGEKIYVENPSTVSQNCGWYSEATASQTTKVGALFTVPIGEPSVLTVPTGAYYLILVCMTATPFGDVYRIDGFIDDTAGSGDVSKVWSANKSSAVKTELKSDTESIVSKIPFETVDATIATGYYKIDGTHGNGDSYRNATATVTAGEMLKVTGYTLKGTGFTLGVWFDSNDTFLSLLEQNDNSAAKGYTDFEVIVPQNAAKLGLNSFSANTYPPTIKRMCSIASTDDVANVASTINAVSVKSDDIGRIANYEQAEGTFALGFYNSVGGQWTANNSFGTFECTVTEGECFLITGQVDPYAGMAEVIFFDENGDIVGKINDGSSISEVVSTTDMFVYVSYSGAVKMAVLGQYYDDGHNYYPKVKRGVTNYAHKRMTGVCFGDSIFGNANQWHDIPHFLSEKSDNTVLNGAFGGCRMSVHSGNYDAFSMYRLAYSVVNDDWTRQDAALADPEFEPPAYAAQHLANLKDTDFDKVDFITIAYGTNDWRGGNALDDQNNPTNTSTIAGALRYSLNLLMDAFKQIDVYVLSPLWRVVEQEGDTEGHPTGYCDIVSNGTYYLKDVCDTLKSVCDEYHVTYVDDFNLGINRYNWEHWLSDGTHTTDNGKILVADNLVKNIKGILK